jgi:hypothetical protein
MLIGSTMLAPVECNMQGVPWIWHQNRIFAEWQHLKSDVQKVKKRFSAE